MSVVPATIRPTLPATIGATASGALPWEGGGGVPPPIVSLANGTFTRNLAAFQRDSDPTSGAFMTNVGVNVLRYETLTSGGRLALIEGARVQSVRNSRARSTGWTAGTGTDTINEVGCDGTANAADHIVVTATQFSKYAVPVTAPAAPFCASHWQKQPSGGTNTSYHLASSTGAIVHVDAATGLGAAWSRIVARNLAGTSTLTIPCDGRIGNVAAAAHDLVSDLVQIEGGRFASSAILNATGAAVTRPADTLTFAAAPAGLLTDLHGFRHVRPIFTSSLEVADADVFWLLSIADGSNGIRISQTAGVITIEAVAGGVVKASSQPFTTLEDVDLGSVVWSPGAGLVYLNGTAGPAGTAWTWGAGALRVGGIYGGTGEAFCGLSDIW